MEDGVSEFLRAALEKARWPDHNDRLLGQGIAAGELHQARLGLLKAVFGKDVKIVRAALERMKRLYERAGEGNFRTTVKPGVTRRRSLSEKRVLECLRAAREAKWRLVARGR